ncbi:hypothetical protein ACFO5K_25485 [Nocardia halotolerans]|uniref:TY-Chap N-terminal domain-containing protein n=1 Tax=Nocardia halotolerans TaxID=1755878 RepID=A0ABV8VP44_9NOCA
MTDWAEFARVLADELAAAPDTTILVIGEAAPAGSRRFAQFRKDSDSVLTELTGNEWLDPASRPGDAGRQAITRAGWNEPNQDHCDNWWAEFATPVGTDQYRHIAAITVTGLRDGFGITTPAALSYKGWVETSGNNLHLPSLGIPDAV